MRSKFRSLALLLLLTTDPHAVVPASGVWWNPHASGSGFEIDRQAGTMVVSVYAYDQTGASLWYLIPGQYDDATSTLVPAILLRAVNASAAAMPAQWLRRPVIFR